MNTYKLQKARMDTQRAAKKLDQLEGLDLPHLTTGHLITPMRGDANGRKDGAGVEQAIGRIQRRDPDNPNKQAIWYDYVDYNVGVFKGQYQSRRSVYRRLGLSLPRKPKTEAEKVDEIFRTIPIFN